MSKEQFRLHPAPGEERPGKFSIPAAVYSTIKNGGLGSGLLVPHFAIPIYGIYALLRRHINLSQEFEENLALVIGLVQGIALGTAIALSVVRYSATGKAIKGRRLEKTATDEEESKQHRIEVALRVSVYIFAGSLMWEYLNHSKYSPVADDQCKHTSSGFLTASGSWRNFFNNESILPEAKEARSQLSGVGLNYDLKQIIKDSPKVRVPGTAPPKGYFLCQWEKAYRSLSRGNKIGWAELGPKNWIE